MAERSEPTRRTLPLILIRGFGGLDTDEERALAYQGFNTGTVYPHKRGENYIYEGLILKLMKSGWQFRDATNVIGFFAQPIAEPPRQEDLEGLDPGLAAFFSGDRIVADPKLAKRLLEPGQDPCRTIWVFRYYDLGERKFRPYGKALVRLIDLVRALAEKDGVRPKVNVIAHSMGGLIVREAVQRTYPEKDDKADEAINKIVTLGTPHRGITFQVIRDLRWLGVEAEEELKHFNPEFQATSEVSYTAFRKHFPLERLLCVVGTNYRTYSVRASSWANRLFPVEGEYGPAYNRSDGLVKQSSAQIDGACRTFVHKCHGGLDSLMTARETFEVATRFLFGDVRARLRLVKARVIRGFDFFGRSELYFGVSIKPRGVDFDLFHQSAEAENCYGPFRTADFSDPPAFGWAGPDQLVWEGFLNSDLRLAPTDLVVRADFYVGERDMFGIGFSDNVIFRKQYYLRAVVKPRLRLEIHHGEAFQDPERAGTSRWRHVQPAGSGWDFDIKGTGFEATCHIDLDYIPETGLPTPLQPGATMTLASPTEKP
jgi:hypothetical protein